MAKLLDRILVIDVEATCWPPGGQPPGAESEIIEIGICEIDVASTSMAGCGSIFVRPEKSEVSPFCTQLTTITPEMAAKGVSFDEACRMLRKEHRSENRVWASYGDYDRIQFERQCKAAGVLYPFGRTHLNVKSLFALVRGLRSEVGMEGALTLLGFHLEGTHHRGGDDSKNIARILCALLARARG